ncbi:MAG: class I SAM-dependent methyltransferase [Acetobacterales bacterium]
MNDLTRSMTCAETSDCTLTIGVPLADYLEDGRWMGGTVYLVNLMEALATLPAESRPAIVLVGVGDETSPLVRQLLSYPFVSIARDEAGAPLGFAATGGTPCWDVLFPCREPVDASRRPIYWIPDLQHLHLPGNFSGADAERRNRETQAMLDSGAVVVVSSESARRDVERFFPGTQARIETLSFCSGLHRLPSPEGDVRAAYGLPEKFLYLPNQFWVHKDHPVALEAIWRLRKAGTSVPVVMSGPTGDYRAPGYFEKLTSWIGTNGLGDLVRYIGVVPRDEQREVFRLAAAVLQPSRFEGWSTTIEDARAMGKTIVASDLPVHREQIGEHGHYFPVGDAAALVHVLGDLWPRLRPGPDAGAEAQAAVATERRRHQMGKRLMQIAGAARPTASVPQRPAYREETSVAPGLCRVPPPGETAWYPPPLAGAETVARRLTKDAGYIRRALALYETLIPDDYTRYLAAYYRDGLERFGDDWVYADIVTVLLCLAETIRPRRYLEIGVRRGRSACAVAAAAPTAELALFDMWVAGYAGMDNPGPALVRSELAKVGHRGAVRFIDGDSRITLPEHFAQDGAPTYDLITVDGDHSDEGAARDLCAVLPHLSVGGAVVFDDIAHPAHPGLAAVWHGLVAGDRRFSSWEFRDAGYGVGFAVRLR